MKQLFTCFSFFIFTVLAAQDSVNKQLEAINSEQEAIEFLNANKKTSKGEVIVFNEAKHKTPLAKSLLKKGKGGTKTVENEHEIVHYKVLEVYNEIHYRASIIMFDSNKATLEDINAARALIIKKYEEGYPFDVLAKQYSMDVTANRGGDLGWFTPGTYIEDLEHKIISPDHATNDMFFVDLPDENRYYIVLKTHEQIGIKQVNVLKVVEPVYR